MMSLPPELDEGKIFVSKLVVEITCVQLGSLKSQKSQPYSFY